MKGYIADSITEYRKKGLEGKLVDLLPISRNDSENIVKLRNKEKNLLFLSQQKKINVEEQNKWYDAYVVRDNDIYWCIHNKWNQFIGTTRLYNINEGEDICEHGSFIIDDKYAKNAPYALEAFILTLDFAFDVLHIGHVCNACRMDNQVINSLSQEIGFSIQKKIVSDNVEYNCYLLDYNNYIKHRSMFQKIVDYFADTKRE